MRGTHLCCARYRSQSRMAVKSVVKTVGKRNPQKFQQMREQNGSQRGNPRDAVVCLSKYSYLLSSPWHFLVPSDEPLPILSCFQVLNFVDNKLFSFIILFLCVCFFVQKALSLCFKENKLTHTHTRMRVLRTSGSVSVQ